MTPVFKLSEVTKKYGTREVLNIGELEIEEGRIYSILGPNGAGKSTLMRIMSLLTVNTTGRFSIFGENITWTKSQLLRLRRQMAMVTQTALMFKGNVYYNVAYGLKARRTREAEQKRIVEECLDLVGMTDFINYPAQKLSGGERQKVALARVLAVKPRVIFLDEPTSNIDPGSAGEIEEHIKLINSEYNATVILVTHNLFQARRLADEILFLWEGRLLERGSAEHMYTGAVDDRTRAFFRGEIVF